MEAIVLCGGIASRLQPIAKDVPKSLLQIRGRPFLEWLLIDLKQKGIERIVLATGHLGDKIAQALGDGSRLGVQLVYSPEPEALGTGGALRLAATYISDWPVLALNGDSYCPFDVTLMAAAQRRAQADATLWLAPAQGGDRYGSVDVNSEGRITGFSEKSPDGAAWISAGIYLLNPAALDGVQIAKVASIERDVFPRLAGSRLAAVRGPAPVVDIGTPDSLAAADSMLAEQFRRLEMKASRNAASTLVADHLAATSALQARVADECGDQIVSAANLIATAFAAGGKLLLCGNGGSAADCQHIAAEFTNRLTAEVERQGLPAIALTTDTSFLTAFTNDYGFENVFARQVDALGRPGDVLLGISTSGKSRNVLAAFAAATRNGVSTICLCGRGGEMEGAADCVIVIPSTDTQLIQEAMLPVEHLVCELVEQRVAT